jgi:sulfate permease, SulP family
MTDRRVQSGDVIAGLSVALVVIPQSLAYAQLAGLPSERGLYVVALAPLVAALTASSPYLQTGPTAVSSLLTLGAVSALAVPHTPGYVQLAALLAIVVGVIRVVVGLLGAGAIAYLLAQPVLSGFTLAAALLIVASQIPTMLDVPSSAANPLVAAASALAQPDAWRATAIAMAVATLGITLGGRKIHPLFPGVFVCGVLGIAYVLLVGYDGQTMQNIPSGLPPFSLGLPWSSVWSLIVPGAVIAIVGFSEPATIARHLAAEERHYWDPNREMVSQGLANLASGVSGGYPAGASFSRSALAKLGGAKTRWSGVITAIAVMAILPFVEVLRPLPKAVLGAIVVVASVSLLDARPALAYWRYARTQFYVGLATFVATIAFTPHVERAILLGIALSIAAHLWRELGISVAEWVEDTTLHLRPAGVLYFASAPRLEDALGKALSKHPGVTRLVLHLDGLGRIDLSGALMLRAVVDDAKDANLEVQFADVPFHAEKIVARVLGHREPTPT